MTAIGILRKHQATIERLAKCKLIFGPPPEGIPCAYTMIGDSNEDHHVRHRERYAIQLDAGE